MVIDTPAIVAAITNEPDGEVYRTAIKTAPFRLMSALSLLEARIVLFSRLGPNAMTTFDELIARAGIVIEPCDQSIWWGPQNSAHWSQKLISRCPEPHCRTSINRIEELLPCRVVLN